jgi:signal transduction histidine kinase
VGRLARLVDDLLLLARADSGALRLDAGPVELDQLLEETAKQGEILGGTRGVSVRLQHLEPLIVQGDGPRLRQVLLNLVDNAVKYTPAGGRVDLSLRQIDGQSGNPAIRQPAAPPDRAAAQLPDCPPGAWAEISVQDTGIGIPAEALPRIFERFYRVDAARAREGGGTGLGLCIAKSIVEGHGGRIEVQSQPDTGSTFRLLLPLAAGR